MDQNRASSLSYDELAKLLKTNLSLGLTSFEASERLKVYGPNQLDEETTTNKVQKYLIKNVIEFFKQFLNPLIQLLLICVIISASIGEYENAISVLISIIIVCSISYIHERLADKSLEKLNKKIPQLCTVTREGRKIQLESNTLVPGDLVSLVEGQKVPADLRLFDIHSLTLNESNLTGETQAQCKTVEISKQIGLDKDNILFYPNLALMGTTVESGHCSGIVVCTGKLTKFGQVFTMLKNVSPRRSPLQMNIDQLSIHLVIFACSIIALLSILGVVQQRSTLDVTFYALSLAVTAIPEGLPVVVAVIMALGVFRLSKRNTIVKSLNNIETLGCVQVFCFDKTGTLTRNHMTLVDIITSEMYTLSKKELDELNDQAHRKHMTFDNFGGKMYSVGRLMEVGTLCNNAIIDHNNLESIEGRNFVGQATECAILDAAIRLGFGDSRNKFERISEIPFNPKSRRMAVRCQRADIPGNNPMYYVKGAWEELLEECTHYYENGSTKPRTVEMWSEYERVCTCLGSQGLRVIALATGEDLNQLAFVGALGISNSPRDGVSETLTTIQNSFNISIKLITGDSKETALAISKQLGFVTLNLEDDYERYLISGQEVEKLLTSGDFDEATKLTEINSRSVFYRIDPIQKGEILKKLQQLDQVVAMMGDGVNDVLSLKQADLSVAIGSGSDVCKDLADIIIVNDDFTSLIDALIEGKGIYYKIRSFLIYQISISLALIFLVAISFALDIECPFSVMQLLFINLLTDGPPAQSLGMEMTEESELELKPRNIHCPLLTIQVLCQISILTITLISINGILFYSLLDDDGNLDGRAQTYLFVCFVLCSLIAAFAMRSKTRSFGRRLFRNLCCCYRQVKEEKKSQIKGNA